MKVWKQIVLTMFLLLAAFAGWAYFYPGANEVLTRAGIDWLPAEVKPAPQSAASRQNGGGSSGGSQAATLVVARPAENETINNRLTAIGTGRALETVSVTPYTGGMMTKLLVKAGARVKEGEPIAQLDAENEQIAADKAQIALQDAQNTLRRVTTLRATNTVTQVQVVDAELSVANAKLASEEASLALSRRTVTAPISGVIGILPVNAGNFVSPQTSIATIDDRSQILIDIWVPERYAPQIKIGLPLTATALAMPGQIFEGKISAVDNMVDEASRTLRVRAGIANAKDMLRAGMSFEVTIHFPGDTYPAVDPLALQWSAEGAFVWRIVDGLAEKVPVRIIQRNTTSILVDAQLRAGDMIVTQGVQSVRAGNPVKITQDSTPPAGEQTEPFATPIDNAG
ncbi:efflux RND transporter periplasmic adaptor subunit [Phyllobacterium salinisoli]|uniref:Efflux RND transporter periplasmic adaptor subunit n=1 Tax=Phyllobacterium salinisoli TaxID=1899321 RepID=A0A368K5R2_9HYPH|nr:efflux RND transporter periplasmic adaptor subunit [Phyllobacterium salinisoli]RCS24728.1 efflux RND transporter periplasmic adaptor subunit [Phyllobacterium salinisoli]